MLWLLFIFIFGFFGAIIFVFRARNPALHFSSSPSHVPGYKVPQHNINLVLVLGGGGARGLAHVGVLEEFEQAGIYPDFIIGCSIGSIVGGLYCSGHSVSDIKDILLPLRREDLLGQKNLNLRYGLHNGDKMREFLNKNLLVSEFEHLKKPLLCVATDLIHGHLLKIGTGPLAPAIQGSCAFPFLFRPVEWEGRLLVDGSVLNPVPANLAKHIAARLVVAVDISELLTVDMPNHLFGVARRTMEISYANQSKTHSQYADILIKPKLGLYRTLDDHNSHAMYEAGRAAAKIYIPVIKERL